MTWKQIKNAAELVDAKIVTRQREHYLQYDAHGECYVDSPKDAWDALQVYKGGHPNFVDAQAELA